MTNFWRPDEPFTDDELALIRAVFEAHQKSTFRDNVSSQFAVAGALSSGRYTNGLVAALSSLGGVHAPVAECMDFLESEGVINPHKKVPGWGNSFIKGEPDEDWQEVDTIISEMNPLLYQKIVDTTDYFKAIRKNIYPNPGCYTAAANLILGIPREIAAYLFVSARLDSWTNLILHNMNANYKEGAVA